MQDLEDNADQWTEWYDHWKSFFMRLFARLRYLQWVRHSECQVCFTWMIHGTLDDESKDGSGIIICASVVKSRQKHSLQVTWDFDATLVMRECCLNIRSAQDAAGQNKSLDVTSRQ